WPRPRDTGTTQPPTKGPPDIMVKAPGEGPLPGQPTPGKYALEFDGKSSYVSIPTLRRNDPGPVTLEAWVQAGAQSRCTVILALGGKAHCGLDANDKNWFTYDSSL